MGDHLHTPSFVGWYGLLQVQARTFEPISREFEARTGLPASWYEVLACLQAKPEGQRMNELAADLLISRGGATKLIARLEASGFVDRTTPKTDRRATYATLTAAGEAAVMAAHPVQLELVHEHFGRFLDTDDLAALTRISCKVLEGLGAECDWVSSVGDHADVDESAIDEATAA